jgi:cold shock CspA family protein
MSNAVAEQKMAPVRIRGSVKATFPNRGFFWIVDVDGTKYFAHQVKVHGYSVFDIWEGQMCSFEPKHDDPRGPSAEHVIMEG